MDLQLKIILKKKLPQTIFELHRIDNSFTFAKIQPGMEFHELGHWVVESVLELENSFYGLISQGFNIEDFEKPRDQRPVALMPKNLSKESIFVEHYVNLLMTELNSGKNDQFIEQLVEICSDKEITLPKSFSKQKVAIIRAQYVSKVQSWKKLPQGKEMELAI